MSESELLTELNKAPKRNRIAILVELMQKTYGSETQLKYIHQLIDESLAIDSLASAARGMTEASCYFFNAQNSDSTYYWCKRSIEICKKSNQMDYCYLCYNLYCNRMASDGNMDIAIEEGIKFYEYAKSDTISTGLAQACEVLGYIYSIIEQYDQATKFYEEEIQHYKTRQTNHPSFILDAYLQGLNAIIASKQYDKALKYLDEMDLMVAKRGSELHEQTILIAKCTGLAYRIDVYTALKQYDKVQMLIPIFLQLQPKIDSATRNQNRFSIINYYHQRKDFNNAYKYLCETKEYEDSIYPKQDLTNDVMRADIYMAVGKDKEAANLLKRGCILRDTLLVQRMTKQLAYFNTQHNVNKLIEENRKVKEHQNKIVFISIVCVSISLFIMLIITCLFYYREHILNNKLINQTIELKQAWKKADESNRLQTAFLQNISHEIRTPLNAIVGFSDVLAKRNWENQEEQMMATCIGNNSEQLLNLVNDLIEISSLESGTTTIQYAKHNLKEICQSCVDNISSTINNNVSLRLEYDLDDDFEFITDDKQLKHILHKLLNNSAKFTSAGTITLSAKADNDSNQLIFSVTDTGIGIPAAEREHIFERFQKLNSFTIGFGLGLSICKMIVELMNGKISIDDNYNNGAKLIVSLPLKLANSEA